jgi:hypothetical protein
LTTTMTRQRASSNGAKGEPVGIEPAKRRQRSVPLALVAAACMLVSIVAFVGLQLASSDRSPVLAVARPVEAGSEITEADLVVAQVGDDPSLSPIPLSAKSSVLGRTAAVDLRPGTLLVQSSLGEASVVGDGESLVGVEVPASAAPVGSLRSGDRVQLVEVARPGEPRPDGDAPVITEGRVLRVTASGSGTATTTQLSVVVPKDAGPAVAAASTGRRIAVVVIP